ncbi:MAG TPA: patatin-like phospholipase family protein [Opitutaceae bacterium]|nr:patatin-like phospholipase family protein [Opitutaceae bacterium]
MSEPDSVSPSSPDRPRRILALDGGGIHGVFSLQVLARIEALFREQRKKPDLLLKDEFDLIAGTSTGAIIATMLSWGLSVQEIEQHYINESAGMFTKSSWRDWWKTRYTAQYITASFKRFLSEDGEGREPALLGTKRLHTLLLLIMRNATTGSAWPVTNNPAGLYNNPALENCNLRIPLWQLVRASTAAPTFFPPEQIRLGSKEMIFVDGAITPYNNPAMVAFLLATLPCYRLNWETGVRKLEIVSIGTGRSRVKLSKDKAKNIHLLDAALYVIPALLDGMAVDQDLLCRVLGKCDYGEEIDRELKDLTPESQGLGPLESRKFRYVRYEHRFSPEETELMKATRKNDPLGMDNIEVIPVLREIGRKYAASTVQAAHLGLANDANT